MKRLFNLLHWISLLCLCVACNNPAETKTTAATDSTKVPAKGQYGYDAAFLKKNTRHVLELQDESGQSKVLLSADYQGRVMTSTAAGDSGSSFGWINYKLIESGEKKQHINPVGGEERFWMGQKADNIQFISKEAIHLTMHTGLYHP